MSDDQPKDSSIACAELSTWMVSNGVAKESADEIVKFMDVMDPKSEGYIMQQQFLEFINIVENGNDRATSSASAGSEQKLLDKNLGAKSRFQSDKAHQKQLEYLAAKMKNHRSPFTARKNKIKNARESPSENSEKCSAFTPYKVADAEHTTITANSHLSAFTPEEQLSDDNAVHATAAGKVDMPGTKSKKRKQMRHSERTRATATREQTPRKEIKIHLSGGPPRRKKKQKHKRKPKKKKVSVDTTARLIVAALTTGSKTRTKISAGNLRRKLRKTGLSKEDITGICVSLDPKHSGFIKENALKKTREKCMGMLWRNWLLSIGSTHLSSLAGEDQPFENDCIRLLAKTQKRLNECTTREQRHKVTIVRMRERFNEIILRREKEMDVLRTQVSQTQRTNESLNTQLATLQSQVESTPQKSEAASSVDRKPSRAAHVSQQHHHVVEMDQDAEVDSEPRESPQVRIRSEQKIAVDASQGMMEIVEEKIRAVEEATLDVDVADARIDARIQNVPNMSETLETHDSDDDVVVEHKEHVDSELTEEEEEAQSTTADDDMTKEEVNEYLQDLYESNDLCETGYESEQDKHFECENDDDDILEYEDPPSEFPTLLQRLQQLRQSI